jgi:predicted transcriptional regulator
MKRFNASDLHVLLSDHRRWAILRVLAREGPMPAGALAPRIAMDMPWTSRNLCMLREAGLVTNKYPRVFQIHPDIQPAPDAEFIDLGDWLLRLDVNQ